MRIVLIGPPGVGKGTQAVELSKTFSMPHISTGEMLRDEVRHHSDIGRQVEECLADGKLVPDPLILAMVRARLQQGDTRKGFLLDGFPRSVYQAESLDTMLKELRAPLSAVVLMTLPDQEIVERLSYRRTCTGCGRSYHLKFNPPHVENTCDACGAALFQRDDDSESAILTRLEVYHRQTEPVLDYYRVHNLLMRVEAHGDIDVVREGIVRSLQRLAA